jgi:type IV secretion system protein VirB10
MTMNLKKYVWLFFSCSMFLASAPIYAQDAEKVTIPAGTKFKASLQTPISSKLSEIGDTVVISLLEPVPIDGRHALPRGTEMTGKVTLVKRPGRVKGKAEVYALINELTTDYGSEVITVSIASADDFTNEEKIKTDEEGKLISNRDLGDDFEKAAKGAGVGSLGSTPVAIATGNVGAAIAGPAAGAIVGLLLTRGKDIRLPAGTLFRMKFDKDLILPVSVTLAQRAR